MNCEFEPAHPARNLDLPQAKPYSEPDLPGSGRAIVQAVFEGFHFTDLEPRTKDQQ